MCQNQSVSSVGPRRSFSRWLPGPAPVAGKTQLTLGDLVSAPGPGRHCTPGRRSAMSPLLHLAQLLLAAAAAADNQLESCQLPSGGAAVCVDIARCGHLTQLIANLQKPFPGDVTLLIRDSFLCRATASSVSVCCPLDGLVSPLQPEEAAEAGSGSEARAGCGMQGGAAAECVTYSQCSPFVQLLVNLVKPLNAVVPAMIK